MDNIKKYIEIIRADKKTGQRIFCITLITLLFVMVMMFKNPESHGSYIYDKSGNVVGIQRNSLDAIENYNVILSIPDDESFEDEKVNLELEAKEDTESDEAESSEDDEVERDAEIDGIITDIELSESKKVIFPDSLSDGTKLVWTAEEKRENSWIIIVGSYFLLLVLVIKSSLDERRNEGKQKRREIMRSLPRFTNQLLLMLNAGMILSDAFEKICLSYMMMEDDEKGYFERSLIRIYEDNTDNRVSTAYLLSEFATENSVKELMRISTILTENEKRGSDIVDNLSRESNYLWDERKIVARESGKLIDTKMTYPLGILLILLIVITMAPALLGMG